MLQGSGDTQARSKVLRQQMSPPEIKLWMALKGRPAGLKFRKQHPAGPYTADFYCHAARLVVEIDGVAHDFGDRPYRDSARDDWFRARGLAVMRIAASDVLRDCDAAVTGITATATARLQDWE
ncbi:endonuclease domain-containing protein [Roseomonas aeriglobus]|nr:endonuclease domain-containing protein [Roseomonas aeriglobus]